MLSILKSLQPVFKILPAALLCIGCANPSPSQQVPQDSTASDTTKNTSIPSDTAPLTSNGFMKRADVQDFYRQVVAETQLPPDEVASLLSQAQRLNSVIKLMAPRPPGAAPIVRDWPTYRRRFVEPIRIERGIAFYREHHLELELAEKQYGVPASIITAIIGVETLYGQQMGNYKVLDAITTLAFDYPEHPRRQERVDLFRNQLKDLLILHHEGKLDARRQLGSYAGAIGIPQFMPSSVRKFAVSADPQSQRVDLEHNVNDAIMSVANFLASHGWVREAPVFAPVDLPSDAGKWVTGGITPNLTWAQLLQGGARLKPGTSTKGWGHLPLGVIDLPTASTGQVQYRVGTPNFFALTQYNRSYFYATSVTELAKAIQEAQ